MLKKIASILVVFALFACSKGTTETKTVEGKIVFIQGKVQKSIDGQKWADLALNQTVTANDWLKTGDKSLVKVAMWTSSSFIVKSNSIIQLKDFHEGQKFLAEVKSGGIKCSVEKLKDASSYYKVSGLALAAGVRGTQFEVYTDGKKEYLKVNEGSVWAKRNIEGAKDQVLTAGKVMSLSIAENEALKKKLEGKSKEEAEKLLEVPVSEERDMEKELPEGMKEEISKMEQFQQNATKKHEEFVEQKSQAVEKHQQEASKKIDKMSSGFEEESADDMLKKAKKKRQAQQGK